MTLGGKCLLLNFHVGEIEDSQVKYASCPSGTVWKGGSTKSGTIDTYEWNNCTCSNNNKISTGN